MKRCELCKSVARIYCDSDQASLCWTCDAKVHSANFLVARHSRCLLCHSCQSPTQWSASGGQLEPSTVSICERCVVDGTDDDGTGTDDDEEYDGDEDEIDLDERQVVDDNQAVRRSYTPPPPAESYSSSEEFLIAGRSVSMKRQRRNVTDLCLRMTSTVQRFKRNHRTHSSTVVETAIGGEKAVQDHSFKSRSETIAEKLNRNRKRNMTSGENKSAAVGFDLNLPASSL